MPPGVPSLLRVLNDRSALERLLEDGPLTRAELGRRTGLSRVTASQLLSRLQARGLVQVVGERSSLRGPRAELYAVAPDVAFGVGVDLGPQSLAVAVAGLDGAVLATATRAAPADGGWSAESVVGAIDAAVRGVQSESGVEAAALHTVVVGVPGLVDAATGEIVLSFDLPAVAGPLGERLAARLATSVQVANDVNLVAVTERREGAARGIDDFAMLWVGRGVGLAVVADGVVRLGAGGAAGEVGYLPVPGVPGTDLGADDPRGAFQRLVGDDVLLHLAAEYRLSAPDGATAVREAAAGAEDDAARAAFLAEVAERVALGAAAVVAVLDPALVVLCGPTAIAGGSALADLVSAQLRRLVPACPSILPTAVPDGSVLSGAVFTAVDRLRQDLLDDLAEDHHG